MPAFLRYLVISTSCLSILFMVYLVFFRKGQQVKHLRYYLLISMLLAMTIPLTDFNIQINLPANNSEISEVELHSVENGNKQSNSNVNNTITSNTDKSSLVLKQILTAIYLLGLVLLLIRIIIHFLTILQLFFTSDRTKKGTITILKNKKIQTSFSFFWWVFIPGSVYEENGENDIIIHESIHASQYHSIDIIMIELLSAAMWFNPLVWMMKKSVQLVHEYLADEGVLSTGVDKLEYQALLINQIAEERLICLSSGFNHSLIKKRMIMMTKSKFNQQSKLRILVLIPLATVLFIGVACVNGQKNPDVVAAVEPVRMNVLYLGVENPVNIAVSGYSSADITPKIDNGTIKGEKGEYIVFPKEPGKAVVTLFCNGKAIYATTFRVKEVPNPVASIGNKTSGTISKKELLEANGITVDMKYFDFDLSFDIVSFVISSQVPNSHIVREEISHSAGYSELQIDLINSLIVNQKLMVEEITVKGPDGSKRKLSPMVFRITE